MFNWPETIETENGTIVITGRHFTDHTTKTMDSCCMFTLFATIVGCGIITFLCGQSVVVAIAVGLMSFIPGAIVSLITYPLFLLTIARPRTTVEIAADFVKVNGVTYNRTMVPIQFTNLYPQSIQLSHSGGGETMIGALQETKGMRMFFGGNAVLITTFDTVEKASRFSFACAAAASRVATSVTGGFGNVTVSQLYQGGYADGVPIGNCPALPGATALPARRRSQG